MLFRSRQSAKFRYFYLHYSKKTKRRERRAKTPKEKAARLISPDPRTMMRLGGAPAFSCKRKGAYVYRAGEEHQRGCEGRPVEMRLHSRFQDGDLAGPYLLLGDTTWYYMVSPPFCSTIAVDCSCRPAISWTSHRRVVSVYTTSMMGLYRLSLCFVSWL